MNKNDWNAGQYMKFAGERTQPSIDLLNRVHNNPAQILDMGCGPGNSTNVLFEKFKDADIMGIDASQNMLDRAKNDYPHIIFKKCIVPDELDVIDKKFDLIFSNACIHWIPNQIELLNAVIKKLNNGGSLAVQIPLIQEAPFYKILFETIKAEKWKSLREVHNFHNLMPEEYYDLLSAISSHFEMWQTTYFHTVDNFEGIINWYEGSGLRPYLELLDDDQKQDLKNELLEKIKQSYSVRSNGKVILKMPRLFFVAYK